MARKSTRSCRAGRLRPDRRGGCRQNRLGAPRTARGRRRAIRRASPARPTRRPEARLICGTARVARRGGVCPARWTRRAPGKRVRTNDGAHWRRPARGAAHRRTLSWVGHRTGRERAGSRRGTHRVAWPTARWRPEALRIQGGPAQRKRPGRSRALRFLKHGDRRGGRGPGTGGVA